MAKTVANLRDSLSGMLQGLNMNNVKNLNVALERTARQTCVKLEIPEAVLQSNLILYDGVYDYTLPTDIFASGIIDIRPQGINRSPYDGVQKQPNVQFDQQKALISGGTTTTVEYDKGTGVLRVAAIAPTARIELDSMSATTGWTAAGTASSLTTDSTVIYQSPSSLRCTVATGTGTLTKTISSTDLTSYQGVGVGFLAFRTPSASNLTSIELRIGSSAANYYSVIVTTGFVSAFKTATWMLAAFDLSTATTVGTPVITAMTYVQVRVVAGATLTNFYVGDLWISLPSPQTLIYSTDAIFLASGSSTPSTSITLNTDTILLNDAAYAIFELECAVTIANQQGGTLASGVVGEFNSKLNGIRGFRGVLVQPGLLDLYRAESPARRLREVGSYYDI